MNKEKVKAALDELAIWQYKHNAIITSTDNAETHIDFVDFPPFGPAISARYSEEWGSWELTAIYDDCIESVDPAKLSAHDKLKWGLV